MSCASRQSLGLGITLVVCGTLAFVFNGVAIASADALTPVAHGFWGGAMVSGRTAAFIVIGDNCIFDIMTKY